MGFSSEEIRENYWKVKEKIFDTAIRAGRKPEDIRLVVVTKAQPVSVVQAVIDAGACIVGENYPEETAEKLPLLNFGDNPVEIHMIGHLQSRKAKIVAEHFDLLQSLDSLSLAEKMERICSAKQKILPVLLEFNVGVESSKSGWQAAKPELWNSFYSDLEKIIELKHLSVRGLMTMPPLFEEPEHSRPYFKKLLELQENLSYRFPQVDWSELSMGTSSDYLIAIEEGATLVRVGTAIVGQRVYKHL